MKVDNERCGMLPVSSCNESKASRSWDPNDQLREHQDEYTITIKRFDQTAYSEIAPISRVRLCEDGEEGRYQGHLPAPGGDDGGGDEYSPGGDGGDNRGDGRE